MPNKITLAKYKAEHLMKILEHPSQLHVRDFVQEEHCISLERHEYCFSVLKDGEPIACIGLSEYWKGRCEAWAFLIPGHRDAFIFIHNAVKKFLKKKLIRRIEATVEMNFYAGHRWARLLGFEVECERLHSFGPTGNDHKLYVYLGEEA